MTFEQVRLRVEQIRLVNQKDCEIAHSMLDDLWEDVLTAIAVGDDDRRTMELAGAALKAKEYVTRWYA